MKQGPRLQQVCACCCFWDFGTRYPWPSGCADDAKRKQLHQSSALDTAANHFGCGADDYFVVTPVADAISRNRVSFASPVPNRQSY
jgi:hypothetical protein